MAYETNFLTMLNGHTDFPVTEEGGGVTAPIIPKGKFDDTADVSDILSNFVGKGYKGFSDEDAKHDFAALAGVVGKDKATQLMKHVFIFNNRDDIKNKTPQQKLQTFYSMGATDPDINSLLNQVKAVQGQYGLNTSSNIGSKQLSGRDVATEGNMTDLQLNTLKTYAPK